jgi:hypothetical protein
MTMDPAPTVAAVLNTMVRLGTLTNPISVTSMGYPAPKLKASSLPSGVHFANNGNGAATISGTPRALTTSINYPVTITASNKTGSVGTPST